MTFDIFSQVLLCVLGIASFLLVAKQNHYSIYGFWIGLFCQPLWFYTSYIAEQWAVIAMLPFYVYGNIVGIRSFHEP